MGPSTMQRGREGYSWASAGGRCGERCPYSPRSHGWKLFKRSKKRGKSRDPHTVWHTVFNMSWTVYFSPLLSLSFFFQRGCQETWVSHVLPTFLAQQQALYVCPLRSLIFGDWPSARVVKRGPGGKLRDAQCKVGGVLIDETDWVGK